MLSDEEKQAIEYIENCLDDEYDYKNATRQKDKKAHNIILNLIEKQQKEIEEYKKQLDLDYVDKHFVPVERYNQLEKEIEELKEGFKIQEHNYQVAMEEIEQRWKDKIKAEIEERNKWLQEYDEQEEMNELQKDDYRLIKVERNILQSLLEKE